MLYGWLILAAIALSAIFWARLARRDDRLLLIYIAALLGAFVGAKIMYLLAEGWLDFGEPDMWRRFATGKSIVGGLLGGYAAVEAAKHFFGYRGVTGDWFAMIVPVGIILGRIGCWTQGCCLGAVCEPAWFTLRDVQGMDRWPAVPLEIAFNLFAILFLWALRHRSLLRGQHFHLYLIAYGIFHFLHEFVRATPRIGLPVTGYQIGALALILLGGIGFIRRQRSRAQPVGLPLSAVDSVELKN
jgi:phosphatidylglycerol:prolipoprotein diacylglycerol transferase